ncbi:TetR family transcriptional regulator [Spirosoma sp. HMF4905]|uniref:TetR family transcriptional regulator n=1 Tax=Spirosoma arboris TaxID=2682092 RepID=A0A7K1S8K5_9BACT|nr:TetR/AcrR family transcriptional regulator [Spirosoma arboris]MVM30152.1 TetR family transcriptional regulator [Spirosoma arboris]
MEGLPRNRTQTTQRIVEALEEEINEWGWQAVAVNRIAQKAGVSKTLIYRYFGSLEGLMVYYLKMGKLFPVFTPQVLDHLRPLQKSDLARIWYRQVIQTYRSFRSSKPARELLKATLSESDPTADMVSEALDEELTRLVEQLTFVEGTDTKAVSAVILGAMSYLTIMAQNNRTVVGIDLRSEAGWERIEEAVKLLYIGVNKLAVDSDEVTLTSQLVNAIDDQWP